MCPSKIMRKYVHTFQLTNLYFPPFPPLIFTLPIFIFQLTKLYSPPFPPSNFHPSNSRFPSFTYICNFCFKWSTVMMRPSLLVSKYRIMERDIAYGMHITSASFFMVIPFSRTASKIRYAWWCNVSSYTNCGSMSKKTKKCWAILVSVRGRNKFEYLEPLNLYRVCFPTCTEFPTNYTWIEINQ